jgi:myo-inositol-1-phosphate synthase
MSEPRKTGVLLVGLGGNNGSTFVAGLHANREQVSWQTKSGKKQSNYIGSLSQSSVIPTGYDNSQIVYKPFCDIINLHKLNDLVVSGWDICGDDLMTAMEKSEVLHYNLQSKLKNRMSEIKPLKSLYYPDFIARNQGSRADNIHQGSVASMSHVMLIQNDIRQFKKQHELDHVIVMWTASTERFMKITQGVHDTQQNLLKAIEDGNSEISPSLVFAVASVLEGCTYLNGAPQNTLVPGLRELAIANSAFVGGNDFKTGQTKVKSVLTDFLVSSGYKLTSIVSYNHLGNNDGKNLSSKKQCKSKEISKKTVVDDVIDSNKILFPHRDNRPDHTVVIEYVPSAKDDKKAIDEYVCEIFMNGTQTINMNTVCPDSLLAVPVMYDLVVFSEWLSRVKINNKPLNNVLSHLALFFKSPAVNGSESVSNAFFTQRNALANLALASRGMPPFNPLKI